MGIKKPWSRHLKKAYPLNLVLQNIVESKNYLIYFANYNSPNKRYVDISYFPSVHPLTLIISSPTSSIIPP